MRRTTVVLPRDLEARAKRRARERGVSFAELIRLALARELGARSRVGAPLPFLRELPHARRGRKGPADLSANLERYLYGPRGIRST